MIYLSDIKTFELQYKAHFTALKHFAKNYLDDEEVVLDILQDLFLKLYEKRLNFETEEQLKAYLYRSLQNNCLTYIRNNERAKKQLKDYTIEESDETFINAIIESEVFNLINKTFEELPEACKNVYKLSLQGKSHKEIAEELNISVNTIKRHKNYANHFLQKKLQKILEIIILVQFY